jgi:hypothetical protein
MVNLSFSHQKLKIQGGLLYHKLPVPLVCNSYSWQSIIKNLAHKILLLIPSF